jgi:Animal haem peroxidase
MTATAECPINGRFVQVGILSGFVILFAHVVAWRQAGNWTGAWSPPADLVVYWFAILTIWATVALLTPALCFLILFKPGAIETYWRSFWTFAYIALLFHLYWAIAGVCKSNFEAIFNHGHFRDGTIQRCLVEHPKLDFGLAFVWGFDLILVWLVRQERPWIRRFTGLVHIVTFGMFLGALMASKASRGAHIVGMIMAGVVLPTYLARVAFRQPDPNSFGVWAYVTLYRLINRIRIVVGHRLVWHRMPLLFAIGNLDALREVLRAKNLHNTSEIPESNPDGVRPEVPYSPAYLYSREADGWYNDLTKPSMGSASLNHENPLDTSDFTLSSRGARFGRNIPLTEVRPERDEELLDPNPRDISNVLLARKHFVPATTLNLLAAAWIQFQVHDWFNHGSPIKTDLIEVPTRPGDEPLVCPMRIRPTRPDPTRKKDDGKGPATFVNAESHWWDGSQIYGSSEPAEAHLREGLGGRLALDSSGLLPMEDNGLERTGLSANWWIGLSLMHNLFAKEHNAICDHLAREYPGWDDGQLYRVARLVNVALMAKIHTLEWTPAILGHPVLQVGMKGNWWGFATERIKKALRRISEGELVSGIPGSDTNHHKADYCLTEEFVSVYRMHALMPDRIDVYSLTEKREPTTFTLDAERDRAHVDAIGPGARDRALRDRLRMEDLFYSLGLAHPGALVLHNYPDWMRRLQRRKSDGTPDEFIDLAAIDIVRDRERGVPRYNRFRKLMHMRPVKSFKKLTSNAVLAKELEVAYGGDLEKVDLMVGMYAEDKPDLFGISDTAFRVFLLMASRRLKSDRFFTKDYTPEIYSKAGIDWVENNTMRTVLLRHYPALAPALYHVKNVFGPSWKDVWEPPPPPAGAGSGGG